MRGAGALKTDGKLVSEALDLIKETERKGGKPNQEETRRRDSTEESNG